MQWDTKAELPKVVGARLGKRGGGATVVSGTVVYMLQLHSAAEKSIT